MKKKSVITTISIMLIILSCILFGLIFLVPFLPLSIANKGITVTVLVIGMEVAWWGGVAIAGKQLITKYRQYLNPLSWVKKKREKQQDSE